MPYYSYDRSYVRRGYRQGWRGVNHYARAMRYAIFKQYVKKRNHRMVNWMLRNWNALYHQLRDDWIREGLRHSTHRFDMEHHAAVAAQAFEDYNRQDGYQDL